MVSRLKIKLNPEEKTKNIKVDIADITVYIIGAAFFFPYCFVKTDCADKDIVV